MDNQLEKSIEPETEKEILRFLSPAYMVVSQHEGAPI